MLYIVLRPVIILVFRLIVSFLAGLRVEGESNVPRRGAVIIAPNHLSFADPVAVGIAMRRAAWFMATDEMFEIPVLGSLARFMRAYPIHQDSPDRSALRKTLNLLKNEQAVVIFPEGHVSKDGLMLPIQAGSILLAVQSGAPVLPVGIVNTDHMMPPHQWRLHRSRQRIVVRFGRPIPIEELTGGRKGRAGIDHGAEMLARTIAELAGVAPHTETDGTRRAGEETAAPRNCPA